MIRRRVQVVHKQYNSPLSLYSPESIAENLQSQTRVLANGAVGIDFRLLAAPHLVQSKVLKMLNEEGETNYEPGTKKVAWPPHSNPSSLEIADETEVYEPEATEAPVTQQETTKVAPPVPPKPRRNTEESDANMAKNAVPAPFASNELVGDRPLIAKPPPPSGLQVAFSLKDRAPVTQDPVATVPSQPLFKRSTPLRRLGDMVWPPKRPGQSAEPAEDEMSHDPLKPKREQKNYRDFFMQNQLPPSFPTYRAPPGTQHFGLETGENETAM